VKILNVVDWVKNAVVIVIGAYLIYVLVQSFSEINPGFGYYGWGLLGAFIAGATIFLKYGLGKIHS
jgi:hypothetical protein